MTDKSSLFLKLARPYVARRLRRQFFDVRLAGLLRLRKLVFERPVILACNHVAWWDPLLLVHLDGVLGSDGFCLMDKQNLAKLPFFRWLGALPVDLKSRHAAYRDVLFAGKILDSPRRILAIFPQGVQRPAHFPLNFKSGVAALAERTGAPVVPLAIRYDFLEAPRQVVHLKVGEPLLFSQETHTRELFLCELEERIKEAFFDIDHELFDPKGDFASLLGRTPLDSGTERIPLPAVALRALSKRDVQ